MGRRVIFIVDVVVVVLTLAAFIFSINAVFLQSKHEVKIGILNTVITNKIYLTKAEYSYGSITKSVNLGKFCNTTLKNFFPKLCSLKDSSYVMIGLTSFGMLVSVIGTVIYLIFGCALGKKKRVVNCMFLLPLVLGFCLFVASFTMYTIEAFEYKKDSDQLKLEIGWTVYIVGLVLSLVSCGLGIAVISG